MNKILYILLASVLLLGSCDKVKKTKKTLEGQWEIISYSRLNAGGLTHYFDASGFMTFGPDTDSTFTFSTDYTVEDGGTSLVQTSGIGTFLNESGLNYKIDITTPSPWLFHQCSIQMITKDDLKVEHRDSQYTYTIVLRKD